MEEDFIEDDEGVQTLQKPMVTHVPLSAVVGTNWTKEEDDIIREVKQMPNAYHAYLHKCLERNVPHRPSAAFRKRMQRM